VDEESFTDGDDTRTEMLSLATMPFSAASEENVKEIDRRPYKVKPSAKNYARPLIPPLQLLCLSLAGLVKRLFVQQRRTYERKNGVECMMKKRIIHI
jgi:hypothetical protein